MSDTHPASGTGDTGPGDHSDQFSVMTYLYASLRGRTLRYAFTITGVAVAVGFFIIVTSLGEGLIGAVEEETIPQGAEEYVSTGTDAQYIEFESEPPLTQHDLGRIQRVLEKELATEHAIAISLSPIYWLPLEYAERSGFAQRLDTIAGIIGFQPEEGVAYRGIRFDPNKDAAVIGSTHIEGGDADASAMGAVIGYERWVDLGKPALGERLTLEPSGVEWTFVPASAYPLTDDSSAVRVLLRERTQLHIIVQGVLDHNIATDHQILVHWKAMANFTYQTDHDPGIYYITRFGVRVAGADERVLERIEAVVVDELGREHVLVGWDDRATSVSDRWTEPLLEAHRLRVGADDARTIPVLGTGVMQQWLRLASGVILIAALLTIANTVFMSMLERRRELGVMRAVGMTARELYSIILIEGCWIGAIGYIAGALFGVNITNNIFPYLHRTGTALAFAPARATPDVLAFAAVATIGMVLVASIIPARRAMRLDLLAMIER